ncbi:MAG: methyltransferase domain-containing protein [Acidobacteria bacterium]|nr:methyltransferase domain-containing protein [Acidobacteriota bacterium]
MSNSSPEPSPLLFFENVNAYQRTAALKGAIELDLFSAIGAGAETAAELVAKCDASERGIRILCDYLVVHRFLTKEGDRYRLTPDSAIFLTRESQAYLGAATEFLLSSMLADAFRDIAGAVRKGGTVVSAEGTVAPDHPVWVKFARGMSGFMTMPAQLMAKLIEADPESRLKVLDIAAGHGMFGIAVAQRFPHAEIVALDWPNVLEVAKENAEKAGVGDRYSTLAGSAFEVEFGSNYDVVLIPNFLHHFDEATCVSLLKKVHGALADDGRVVTVEFVPNEDRISPPDAAAFSLVMLASTPQGDAYTFNELERMLRQAGFSRTELHDLPPTPQRLLISEK